MVILKLEGVSVARFKQSKCSDGVVTLWDGMACNIAKAYELGFFRWIDAPYKALIADAREAMEPSLDAHKDVEIEGLQDSDAVHHLQNALCLQFDRGPWVDGKFLIARLVVCADT